MKFNSIFSVVAVAGNVLGAVPNVFGSGSGADNDAHTGIIKIGKPTTTTGVERRGADSRGVLGWNPKTHDWCWCRDEPLPESVLKECCLSHCESCTKFIYFDNCASVAMTPDGHWAVASEQMLLGTRCSDTEVDRLATEYIALQMCSRDFIGCETIKSLCTS